MELAVKPAPNLQIAEDLAALLSKMEVPGSITDDPTQLRIGAAG